MQFTVDTRTATQFELSALGEFIAKLQAHAPERVVVFENTSVNDSPDDSSQLGNAPAPTDIPPAPASAPESVNPPPVPAVPSVTPATGASEVPAVPSDTKLDSAGFPWDARINTANKGTIGDGTWRKKPGVDPALVDQVRAELKAGAAPRTDAPSIPSAPDAGNAVNTGATSAAQSPVPDVPAVPTLSAQDVLSRCTDIQMSDMSKGAALFQAIVGAGVAGGPMALTTVTDPSTLAACLAAVNAVGAA